jgi:nitrite reductase/ring-hydroxylating ferredoxin subunit
MFAGPAQTGSASVRARRVGKEQKVAICEVCGNDYDKAFGVVSAGNTHTFDSFECAIHALAPVCAHCGCPVIGHGVETDGRIFCCAHCAEKEGVTELRDRTE